MKTAWYRTIADWKTTISKTLHRSPKIMTQRTVEDIRRPKKSFKGHLTQVFIPCSSCRIALSLAGSGVHDKVTMQCTTQVSQTHIVTLDLAEACHNSRSYLFKTWRRQWMLTYPMIVHIPHSENRNVCCQNAYLDISLHRSSFYITHIAIHLYLHGACAVPNLCRDHFRGEAYIHLKLCISLSPQRASDTAIKMKVTDFSDVWEAKYLRW